jgi:hypothetical protein
MEEPSHAPYKGTWVFGDLTPARSREVKWLDETIAIIGEFGSASIGLVAWELSLDESELEPAWEQARRDGLIRLACVCPTTKEQMFVLTSRPSSAKRGAIEPKATRRTSQPTAAGEIPHL